MHMQCMCTLAYRGVEKGASGGLFVPPLGEKGGVPPFLAVIVIINVGQMAVSELCGCGSFHIYIIANVYINIIDTQYDRNRYLYLLALHFLVPAIYPSDI